jgi:hypothetical protein
MALIFVFIIIALIVGAIIFAIYVDRTTPKWKKLYNYVNAEMYIIWMDGEYFEVIHLSKFIKNAFNLTPEQADECIKNWRDKEWFKNNIT